MPEGLEVELATVRDWLRYAVSRFGAAGLVYGHGSSTALDEAAYLILHTLHLPIDQLDPWLDARLLPEERLALNQIIEARIASRKPAAYITKEAWIQGIRSTSTSGSSSQGPISANCYASIWRHRTKGRSD